MPNWCNNNLLVEGNLDALTDFKKKTLVLNEDTKELGFTMEGIYPTPKPLLEQTSPVMWRGELHDEEGQKAFEEHIKSLKERFGHEDWYGWRIANWGTKWDVCDADVHYATTTRLVVEFNTAWAPPEKFYETLGALGFTVHALYNEFGSGFCGIFTNDSTTADGTCYVEYHQMMTDEERSQHIPSVLLETFHINEMCNDE